MQVYLVLWSDGNDGKRLIVGTKRWLNDFWGNKKSKKGYVAQNQSGQYSLNGGKVETGTSADDAKREFAEETGLDSSLILSTNDLYTRAGLFVVVGAQLDDATLDQWCAQMNQNVAPHKEDPDQPAGANVKDWEFERFTIVNVSDAKVYLGEKVEVPDEWKVGNLKFCKSHIENKIADLQRRNKHSQSIDWFGEIAGILESKLD